MEKSKKGKGKGNDCNRESKKKKIDENKDVDPQLWYAIAGAIVRIPKVNSNIFYFPQGHAEHAYEPVHFPADIKIPSRILCRVAAIHYRADPDTDEVYAKLRLVPLHTSDVSFDDDAVGGINDMSVTKNKYQSFTKTLTESDAYSGGFACPRYCAETLFPPLDYSGTPPSQEIYLTDVHGETWEVKHFYRGMPRRHLITTGWTEFVTKKKLVSEDSLVFLRAENGDLRIGIRRSKSRKEFGFNPSSRSKPDNEIGIHLVPSCGKLASSAGEKDDKLQNNDKGNELRISDKVMGIGKVKAEDVIEAVKLGVNMQPFDVVYYPGVGTPEFFVETSLIRTTLQTQWYNGMRFKMVTETEDSSRIIWFYGTITSFLAADPAWPDSLWRLLQVTWDEHDLLKNTKRVNPWQVDIVEYVPPAIPFSPFLPSCEELRLPQLPTSPMDGQFSMPTFPMDDQVSMPGQFSMPTFPMDDQVSMPTFPTDGQVSMPTFPTDGQVSMPTFPTDGQVSMPTFPTDGQVSMPTFPTDGQVSMPTFPTDDQVSMPTFPLDDQVSMPTFPMDDQVSMPTFPMDGQVSMPTFPMDGQVSMPTFPMDGQFSMPTFPNNFQTPNVPISDIPETSTACMQGARHDYFSLSESDFHHENIPLDPVEPYFQQPFNHDDATTSTTVPNNPALQKASTSENVSCSTQPSENLDHAKPEELVPFGQTIQIDSGNENSEKKITSSSSDPLQDLPKCSSGERLECNPENQCQKDASAGETVEIEHSVSSSKKAA